LPLTVREFRIGVACAIAVILIWASFIIFSRMGARGLIDVFDLAFLRFAFGAAAVLPCILARPAGRRLGSLTAARLLVLACFGALGFTGFAFAGFARAPAAHAAVLMPGTLPFATALVALFVLGERISGRKALGLAAILAGIALMALQSLADAGARTWLGDIMFPLASLSWAIFTVLMRKWRINAIDATLFVPLTAFLLYAPGYWMLSTGGLAKLSWATVIATGFFQGIIAFVVSMWAFTRVVDAFGPVRTTMMTAVAPALAAVAAVPLLGEPLSLLVVMGLGAVTAGMIIGVGGPPARPAAGPPRPDAGPPSIHAKMRDIP